MECGRLVHKSLRRMRREREANYIVGRGAWLPLSNKRLQIVLDYVKRLVIIILN
jgi:hypothetical protein